MANIFGSIENGPGTAVDITVSSEYELIKRFEAGEIPLGLVAHLLASLGYAPDAIEASMPRFQAVNTPVTNYSHPVVVDPSQVLDGMW